MADPPMFTPTWLTDEQASAPGRIRYPARHLLPPGGAPFFVVLENDRYIGLQAGERGQPADATTLLRANVHFAKACYGQYLARLQDAYVAVQRRYAGELVSNLRGGAANLPQAASQILVSAAAAAAGMPDAHAGAMLPTDPLATMLLFDPWALAPYQERKWQSLSSEQRQELNQFVVQHTPPHQKCPKHCSIYLCYANANDLQHQGIRGNAGQGITVMPAISSASPNSLSTMGARGCSHTCHGCAFRSSTNGQQFDIGLHPSGQPWGQKHFSPWPCRVHCWSHCAQTNPPIAPCRRECSLCCPSEIVAPAAVDLVMTQLNAHDVPRVSIPRLLSPPIQVMQSFASEAEIATAIRAEHDLYMTTLVQAEPSSPVQEESEMEQEPAERDGPYSLDD